MSWFLRGPALALVLWAIAPGSVLAERIVIETGVEAPAAGSLRLFLLNSGDETAFEVRYTAELEGREQVVAELPALPPGRKLDFRLELPASLSPIGLHPVILRVAWRDANRWPLSAVNLAGITAGRPPLGLLAFEPRVDPLALDQEARLPFRVDNLSGLPQKLSLRVLAPAELKVDPESFELELGPDGATREVQVSNRGALTGAGYAVFVLAQSDEGGERQARAAVSQVTIDATSGLARWRRPALFLGGLLVATALLGEAVRRFGSRRFSRLEAWRTRFARGLVFRGETADLLALLAVYAILWSCFPPGLLFLDTTPTGGDTPAHNYLVSHLTESLRRGTVISWAGGFWAGFPMFQFYFPLPYVGMALLAEALPRNVAFKLGSMAGIWALPLCLWWAARRSRSEGTAWPSLAATAALPLLFVSTHSMWGVNARSTLAGMIANSWSFALFVLYLGFALEDLEQSRPRFRTGLLMGLLCLSHFFTTLVAGAVSWLALLLWGRPSRALVRSLALPQMLGAALGSFWLVPLVFKSAWTVEFGGDWDAPLMGTFPAWAVTLVPLVALGLLFGWREKSRVVGLLSILLAASTVLYQVGGRVNASFPNVRFWPFVYFGFVMLSARGVASLARPLAWGRLAALGVVLAVAGWFTGQVQAEAGWYRWNMTGAETKAGAAQLSVLEQAMKGTPGRFLADQGEAGKRFGSDRVFESFPGTIGKAFLAGGILNSATGSLYAYTVQCEISEVCAGFPKLVSPPAYDFASALKHFDLFSVSHVVAHGSQLKRDLSQAPGWSRKARHEDYEVFAREGGPSPLVEVLSVHPLRLATTEWKERSVEWFEQTGLLSTPIVLEQPGRPQVDEELGPEIGLGGLSALVASAAAETTQLSRWELLGPYPFQHDLAEPSSFDPIGGAEATLLASPARVAGRSWRPVVRSKTLWLDALLNPALDVIAYAHSAWSLPQPESAVLLLAQDDEASAFLNGEPIGRFPRRDPSDPSRVEVSLKAGRNDLLLKIVQRGGGSYFSAKLQTAEARSLPGLRTLDPRSGQPLPPAPSPRAARTDCHVEVGSFDDQEVHFSTDCLGQPHMVKQSSYPNWTVSGARALHLVTPNFQLLYPRQREVVLRYGSTPPDLVGQFLTALGVLSLSLGAFRASRVRKMPPSAKQSPRNPTRFDPQGRASRTPRSGQTGARGLLMTLFQHPARRPSAAGPAGPGSTPIDVAQREERS